MSNLVRGPAISTKPCQYWLKGGCHNIYCPFLHPPHGKDKSSKPCYYFQRGFCGRGAKCYFMHAPPSSSQEQPQKNSPLPHPINPDDNSKPPQEQNNNPTTSEESSESDVSFDIILEDNWYGSSNYFMDQIQNEWYGGPDNYNSYERTLHRPNLSGRKRPLEQEAESEIRCPDVSPVMAPCTKMLVAHVEVQNGHNSSRGHLSSRLRGRIKFPERSTSATAYDNTEKRDSPNGYPVQHTELVHSRRNRERERGFTKRSEINASDFPAPKSLAELKRAKIVKEQNDNSTLEEGKIKIGDAFRQR